MGSYLKLHISRQFDIFFFKISSADDDAASVGVSELFIKTQMADVAGFCRLVLCVSADLGLFWSCILVEYLRLFDPTLDGGYYFCCHSNKKSKINYQKYRLKIKNIFGF